MSLDRRELLRVGAAACTGMAGCLASGSSVRYPEKSESGTAPPVDQRNTAASANAAEEVSRPVPNQSLARRTASIFDEVLWFARTWPEATARYRTAVSQARDAVDRVISMAEFDQADLDSLQEALSTAHDAVAVALDGHFRVAPELDAEAAYRLSVTRRFARRGDLDRAREELRRLRAFYARRGTSEYVNEELSRQPIRNRLVYWIRNRPPTEDERPLLTEVRHSKTGFAAFVHHGRDWHLLGDPVDAETRRRLRLFEPLETTTDRVDTLLLAPHEVPRTGTNSDPIEPTNPDDPMVFVQRFTSVAAAGAALESLLDGAVTREGQYPFGGSDATAWHQVYYPHPGAADVAYAFFVQAGPFLLATAPGEVSWAERVEWAGPLERTWLWQP